jgi:hypothetical protein
MKAKNNVTVKDQNATCDNNVLPVVFFSTYFPYGLKVKYKEGMHYGNSEIIGIDNEGMKILDTHLGSGSSRISAEKSKLNFTGYETNEMYYNDQEKRFSIFKSQLRLW